MTSREFCYWLQGYFELTCGAIESRALTVDQINMMRRHLALVFKHEIDPSYGGSAAELQAIHDGAKPPSPGEPMVRC